MLFEEFVHGRQECVADRIAFAGRIEQVQQRRQCGNAGQERDQHAGAGDLAEFRNPLVVGRQEAQETRSRRHRRKRQRHCGAARRVLQRQRQIVVLEPLRTVADAVLNAEVDAEADEQHRECDRQQVERPDHHQADGRGDRKSDEKIDEHGEDDLRRVQRQPENEQHDDDGADSVGDRAVLDRGVFLVGHRHRPGQANPRAIVGREIEILGRLPDRVGRGLARLQRLIVEDRLEFDEGAPIGIGQRLVAGELAPGERRVALVQDILDRLGDQIERAVGIVEFGLPALDAGKPGFQRTGQAANRGIASHDLDQGRARFELARDLTDFFDGQKQQPVLFEELAGTERGDRFEILRVARKLLRERLGRRAGEFWCRSLNHRENQPVAVERLFELVVALAPVEVRRNQRVDVGVDGEVPGRIEAGSNRQHKRENDNRNGKPRTSSNNRDNNTCQHIVSF